jgi:aspartate dehydrogenase
MLDDPSPTRVGLIGHGAIGSVIAAQLIDGALPEMELVSVLDPLNPHPDLAAADLSEMLEGVDLVIEAAGHGALVEHGPQIVAADTPLLIVSVGALADDALHKKLLDGGTGRLIYTTGAIGGLDTLRAAALAGGLADVQMTSTKPASNLLRDWMDDSLRAAIETGHDPVVVFDGTARDACRLFPESANVFAALALATIGFDAVRAQLIADPGASRVRHIVTAHGDVGEYEFTFDNRASASNPKTSAVVPWAVLRGLNDLSTSGALFI